MTAIRNPVLMLLRSAMLAARGSTILSDFASNRPAVDDARRPNETTGSRLVRASPEQHGRDGLDQDEQVVRDRPVLDVEQVQADAFVEGEVTSAADLPQPGDARRDFETLQVPVLVVALV